MSLDSLYKMRRVFQIILEDGIQELVEKLLFKFTSVLLRISDCTRFELVILKLYWYIKKKCHKLRAYNCPTDEFTPPFSILYVDPNKIQYMSGDKFDSWKDTGKVVEGNWDQSRISFESAAPYWGEGLNSYGIKSSLYKAMCAHFVDGLEWCETQFIQEIIDHIENGEIIWHGCENEEEVLDRCEHLDRVYNSIRRRGYKTQKRLIMERKRCSKGNPHSPYEEVFVNIGRNGELLFRGGGNHRLCIAKILNLDTIPVIPVVRHRQWYETKQRVVHNPETEEIPEDLLKHPDIRSIN